MHTINYKANDTKVNFKHTNMKTNILLTFPVLLTLVCSSCIHNSKNDRKETLSMKVTEVDTLFSDTTNYTIELCPISGIDFWIDSSDMTVQSDLIMRLIDAYNSSVVMNSIITDFDLVMRFESEYENAIAGIEDMDITRVKDPEIFSKLEAYRKEMIYLLSADSDTINQEIHSPWIEKYNLYAYLEKKYHVSTFGNIDEDMYHDTFNNCPSVPEWPELIQRRGQKKMITELKGNYDNAKDFDARCIYAIELAHAYEADKDSWSEDDYRNPAIPIMESLMKEQKYSIYLNELWLKWRTLYQDSEGASKDSEIPNHLYNEYRKTCICSTLTYIKEHPNDILAINNYLVMAFEENILREGVYSYGNQYMLDKYKLFREKYNEVD